MLMAATFIIVKAGNNPNVHQQLNRYMVLYLHNGNLYSEESKRFTASCDSMDLTK